MQDQQGGWQEETINPEGAHPFGGGGRGGCHSAPWGAWRLSLGLCTSGKL